MRERGRAIGGFCREGLRRLLSAGGQCVSKVQPNLKTAMSCLCTRPELAAFFERKKRKSYALGHVLRKGTVRRYALFDSAV